MRALTLPRGAHIFISHTIELYASRRRAQENVARTIASKTTFASKSMNRLKF
jgi:hypothetical protein